MNERQCVLSAMSFKTALRTDSTPYAGVIDHFELSRTCSHPVTIRATSPTSQNIDFHLLNACTTCIFTALFTGIDSHFLHGLMQDCMNDLDMYTYADHIALISL